MNPVPRPDLRSAAPIAAARATRCAPRKTRGVSLAWLALLLPLCSLACEPAPPRSSERAPLPAPSAAREIARQTGAPSPTPPRLVLLYAPCSLAKRHLGPYADTVGYTPALSRLAEQSRVFERHHTEAGLSGVAYASMLTGRQVLGHGVYAHPQFLSDDLLLIFEAFAQAGYETFFFDFQDMATGALNYAQGVPALNRRNRMLSGQDRYFQRALDTLRSDPEAKLFVAATFLDTHWPYRTEPLADFCQRHPEACGRVPSLAPEVLERNLALYEAHHLELFYDFPNKAPALGLEGEALAIFADVVAALYASNVEQMDQRLGSVLDAIEAAGLTDETLIAFTPDHGEQGLRENALFPWTHGHTLEREVLEIPWLLAGPGVRPGRHEAVTRSIDLFPTLAGLAHVPVPASASLDGVDLSPSVRGEAPPPALRAWFHTAVVRRNLYTDSPNWKTFFARYPRADPALMWVGFREGDRVFQYRNLGDEQFVFRLFDWSRDPTEREDLFDPAKAAHAEAEAELRDYRARLIEDYERRGAGGDHLISDTQKLRLLKRLGYVR